MCAWYVFPRQYKWAVDQCSPGGAIIGGVFNGLWSLLWWPWSFWAFGIALFAISIVSMFILPSVPLDPEVRGLSYKERIRELDLLGAIVGITAMILFNFAWNQAPGFGWEQPYIYAMLIVGILLFPVFFWIEIKVSKKPLIPLAALSTDVSFVLTCIMCGWAAFGEQTSTQTCSDLPNVKTRNLGLLLFPVPAATTR